MRREQSDLLMAWKDFHEREEIHYELIDEIIARSWDRCRHYPLNIDMPLSSSILNQESLRVKRSSHKPLLIAATEVFKKICSFRGHRNSVVIISDENGYVLQSFGNSHLQHNGTDLRIVEGMNFSEEKLGTNAVGTAMAEQKALRICTYENLSVSLHGLVGAGSPIFDPKGNLNGAVAMFETYREGQTYHLQEFVIVIADAIESRMKVQKCGGKTSFSGYGTRNGENQTTGSRIRFTFDDIKSRADSMLNAINVAKISARNDSTILIHGESGTGKEMFAQAIHNYSYRKDKPFVAINAGTIPRDLVESELFGYEEGAFTGAKKSGKKGKFEIADGGTIFLDEIGDMPLSLQTNLLRVLQEREVTRIGSRHSFPIDVRVISATNKDLQKEINNGRFRMDLFYRLNIIDIPIPPLRERSGDISLLVEHFVKKFSRRMGLVEKDISYKAMEYLQTYEWPGNVRELENVMEGVLIFAANDDTILPQHLPPEIIKSSRTLEERNENALSPMEEAEMLIILRTLKECSGNVSCAAKKLKIARNTLYVKLKKFNIRV
jgi:transcriptional regulator with PAS, ATPase and Fis domain